MNYEKGIIMKKIFITTLIIMFILSLFSVAFAEELPIINAMAGTSNPTTPNTSSGIPKVINTIIGIIQYVGTGISLIVVTILGIKYVMASPQDKAEVKKQITPILIGCILLFGATNIAVIIENFNSELFK